MVKNKSLPVLINMAQKLTFKTQHLLTELEDDLAKQHTVSVITNIDVRVNKYLLLTSLPFVCGKLPKGVDLSELWPVACSKCKSVVKRKAMPTGNLKPKYFVVGDAPGVADGPLDHFARAWANGLSSHMLRKALWAAGADIYKNTWFTNILKCSTPENRPSSDQEVSQCVQYLIHEIELLQPSVIILLGKHVADVFPRHITPVVHAYHPSFYVRQGWTYAEYANHLKTCLEGIACTY